MPAALVARAGAGVKVQILLVQTFLKNDSARVDRLRKIADMTVRVLPLDKLSGDMLHAQYLMIGGESARVAARTGTGAPWSGSTKSARVSRDQIKYKCIAPERAPATPDSPRNQRCPLASSSASLGS